MGTWVRALHVCLSAWVVSVVHWVRSPPEAESLLAFGCPRKTATFALLMIYGKLRIYDISSEDCICSP